MGYRLRQIGRGFVAMTVVFALVAYMSVGLFSPRLASAVGGVPLEFYSATTEVQASYTSSVYADYLSLTVDRSGKSTTKDFYVIADVNTTVSNVAAVSTVRFTHSSSTSVDIGEYADGLTYNSATAPYGQSYRVIKKVSMTVDTHIIRIQLGETGAQTLIGENASIIVIEASDDSVYVERTLEVDGAIGTGVATAFVNALSTAVLADGEQFLFWSAEVMHEDEDAPFMSVRFRDTGNTQTFSNSNSGKLSDPANDGKYYSQGGVAIPDNLTAVRGRIQIRGGGTADETYIADAAILVMPASDFPNVYTDTQTARTHHRRSYSATNLDLNITGNAKNHLILAGVESSNEHPAQTGAWRINYNGGESIQEVYNFDDRDEDSSQWYTTSMVMGTTTAANFTVTVDARSSSGAGAREGVINRGNLVVLEILGLDNTVPVITKTSVTPDPVHVLRTITFSTNWQDEDIADPAVKALWCKTDAVTEAATPTCPGGTWASNTDDYEATDPILGTYVTTGPDVGVNNYYAFICDNEPECSISTAGTFTAQEPPTPAARIKNKGGIFKMRGGTVRMNIN